MLLSKDTVLTAAHNIFDKKYMSENSDFKLYIGANGLAFEYHEIEVWRYPEEFKACLPIAKLPYDYAIMRLKKPVAFDYFLPLSMVCQECLTRDNKKVQLKVFGFPCSCPPELRGKNSSLEENFRPLDKDGKKYNCISTVWLAKGGLRSSVQDMLRYQHSSRPKWLPYSFWQFYYCSHVGGDKV